MAKKVPGWVWVGGGVVVAVILLLWLVGRASAGANGTLPSDGGATGGAGA